MKKAIIIMAKVPEAGAVKTRLQPFLSGEQCCELATCFLGDIESKTQKTKIATIIAYAPIKKKSKLMDILHYGHILIEQDGEDLGERMFGAFKFAFESGFESVVMIGTDSPTMPDGSINEAFERLDGGSDGVLGKTEDGGYYLIGLKSLREDMFTNVEWGTENAFEQTMGNLASAGLKPSLIRTWYDVDLPEDLARLRKELEAKPTLAPHTSEWLKKN